jgi:hypothetical protein
MAGYSVRSALKGAKHWQSGQLLMTGWMTSAVAFCKLPCISLEGVLAAYKTAYWPLGPTLHCYFHSSVLPALRDEVENFGAG